MTQMPMTVEAAELLMPPGDAALHQCRAAIAHLLQLPAADAAFIESQTATLDCAAKERLKLARYIGSLSSLAVFFFTAFVLRDWPTHAGIGLALLLGATQLPLALRLHRNRHLRDRQKLLDSFRPLSAVARIDLAKLASRWPETQATLKRWTSEGRPLTAHEHQAIRRFDYHRSALEDELRAIEALRQATSAPQPSPPPPAVPTQILVQAQTGANVICSAGTVQFQAGTEQRNSGNPASP